MKKRALIISCIVISCLAILALARYSRPPAEKNAISEKTEKDFAVTIGAGMASGSGDEGASLRRIDTPIRLKIFDISNIIGVITLSDALFAALLFIGAILGIYMGACFVRDRMRRPKILSPYEIAVKELAGIDPEKTQSAGDLKELYHRISRILRDYVKEVLAFGPAELTTKEFSAKLAGPTVISGDIKDAVKELAARCDLVKFSGDTANIEEFKSHFDAVRKIIDQINTALNTERE